MKDPYNILWHVRPIIRKTDKVKKSYPIADLLVLTDVLEYLKPGDYLVGLNGWHPNFITDRVLYLKDCKDFKIYKELLLLEEKNYVYAVIRKQKVRVSLIGFIY